MPVMAVTAYGIVFMMFKISVVILEGPTLPEPSDIIVILWDLLKGAAISAAILGMT